MGLFRNITDGIGLTRRKTLDLKLAGLDPKTFINEILGVQGSRETVTLPDGTKQVRFVAKGSTPEQQQFINSLSTQIQDTLSNINELSSITAAIDSQSFSPVIDAVRSQQSRARELGFNQASRLQEQSLARSGQADSTAGIEARAQLASQLTDTATSDQEQLVLLAENLRNQALSRNTVGLNAASNERNTLSNAATGERNASLNLATGQQNAQNQLNLANAQDRQAANASQGLNFVSTLAKGIGGFALGGGFTDAGFSAKKFGSSFLPTPKEQG